MDFNNVKSNQTCHHCSSSGSVASSNSSRSSNEIPDKRQGLRTIHLRKECGIYLEGNCKTGNKLYPNVKANSFGFSFRGGKEFGTGFFISVVEKDSEAEYKGLKVGDQIVRINGLPVDDATHREVLQLAQSHHQLTLTVKNVGIIPVKDKSDDPLTWKIVDPNGNNSNLNSSNVESNQTSPFGCDVDRIIIEIPESTQLGCGICKGPDWRPGIFVQYTKPNSLARRCGLQPGDQILQCNRISFLQIDFNYAVTVLKGAQTLDLVLKKGSGIDLFPGESSGYSSSSSIADEVVTQNPSKPKRLSMVAEEGDERNGRKSSCQCKTGRNSLKPFGSIDSIFDNVSNSGSTYREKSKSIEILTDSNDKKSVAFQNFENVTRTLINNNNNSNNYKPAETCLRTSGGQTIIKIERKDATATNAFIEKRLENGGITSVQVHRPVDADNDDDDDVNGYGKNKTNVEKSSSISSFSSGCSLSSAISREIEKRKERRLKGNGIKVDKPETVKPLHKQQRQHQHDLLIAELKRKQCLDDKSTTISTQTATTTPSNESKSLDSSREKEKVTKGPSEITKTGITKRENNTNIKSSLTNPPVRTPPSCPTPDYYSDNSLTDQSIDASQTVKTSILKFEEKNKKSSSHGTNGVQKTVTFGVNSTKEITPLKKSNCKFLNAAAIKNHFLNMSDKKQQQQQQQQQDKVEMESIESLDLTEPKKSSPKPPPVYFLQTSSNDCRSRVTSPQKKPTTTVIKITEYPTDKPRREPAKFDFINRNSNENGFDSELASTLLRSNLKNKVDAFSNYSNGETVIKTGNDKSSSVNINCISGRLNGLHNHNHHHPIPAVIPTGITENQISTAKKSLKTFEKNASNTVVLKIPKIN